MLSICAQDKVKIPIHFFQSLESVESDICIADAYISDIAYKKMPHLLDKKDVNEITPNMRSKMVGLYLYKSKSNETTDNGFHIYYCYYIHLLDRKNYMKRFYIELLKFGVPLAGEKIYIKFNKKCLKNPPQRTGFYVYFKI
jgi:hypothetical protein